MKFIKLKFGLKYLTNYGIAGIGLGCIASIVLIFITANIYLFEDFELKTLDLRFRLRGSIHSNPDKNAVFEDIIIIDIDDASLRNLGRFQQWPRSYHAEIIDYIKKGNPKAIGFDIFFIEEDKSYQEDFKLSQATLKAKNVVHSMVLSKSKDDLRSIKSETQKEKLLLRYAYDLAKNYKNHNIHKCNISSVPIVSLLENSKGLGYASITPDNDGIVRNVPLVMEYNGYMYPSLALEIARISLGAKKEEIKILPGRYVKIKNTNIPINKEGRMLINYVGPEYSYRYIPYQVILRKDIPVDFFRDKIILIGASAPGLYDLPSTPFSPVYPGVEVHANAIYNILNKNFIIPLNQRATLGVVIFLGALTGFFSSSLRLINSIFGVLMIMLSYFIISVYFFEVKNTWVAIIQPTLNILFCYLVAWIYRYVSIEQQVFSDQLTKTYNRRYFDIKIEKEINAASWFHSPLSIMMLDIDFFKQLNDAYGHLAGDKVLEEVSFILKSTIRLKDTVARYGGEEFVIILPKCESEQAYVIADRIRRNIAEKQFYDKFGTSIRTTISIGVATYPINALNKRDLVLEADQALYQAKDNGRNMVMVAGKLL
ncbi:MAG: CHASE2 domain-containing protein [bacterium]|nr:CHASE2 domain-containing protein [bacterium]